MIELELKILKLEARLAALEGAVEDIGAGDPAPPLRKAVVGGPGVRVRDGGSGAVVESDPSCDGKLTIVDHGGTVLGAFTANQADDTTVTLPDIPSPCDGKLTIEDYGGTVLGEFTANQDFDTTVTLPQPDWNALAHRPDIPAAANDGRLRVLKSDGTSLGSFTANQVGNTDIRLPALFSGDYNDLSNKPDLSGATTSYLKVVTGGEFNSPNLVQRFRILTITDGRVKTISQEQVETITTAVEESY